MRGTIFIAFALCCGAFSPLFVPATPARADWPKPISSANTNKAPERVTTPNTNKAPERVGSTNNSSVLSPIGGPPAGSGPNATPTQNSAALARANAHQTSLPGLIEQMNAGKIRAQRAWDDKLVTIDDLLWIFTDYIGPWGNLGNQKNVNVRRELARLLVKNGAEKLSPLEKLPPAVRLWLADYYQGIGDEKCVTLCESILGEIKTPLKGESALVFQSIERLGWYFRDKGEQDKVAQTWLRMADYQADVGWWTPDALVEAGSAWLAANEWDKAQAVFAKVPAFGNDWYSGMARWEQADALIERGQIAEARHLLTERLPGETKAVPPGETGKVRVGLLVLLAWSHYKVSEWREAREAAAQALALYRTLPGSPQDNGLGAQVAWAKSLSDWCERWPQSPLWCQPAAVQERVASPGMQRITLRLSVQLQSAAPLQISCDNPLIHIKPVAMGNASPKALFTRQDYYLEIGPHDYAQPLDAQITVACDKWPAATRQVPLHVEAAK